MQRWVQGKILVCFIYQRRSRETVSWSTVSRSVTASCKCTEFTKEESIITVGTSNKYVFNVTNVVVRWMQSSKKLVRSLTYSRVKVRMLELGTSGWKSSKADLVWILAETLWAFTETHLFLLSLANSFMAPHLAERCESSPTPSSCEGIKC